MKTSTFPCLGGCRTLLPARGVCDECRDRYASRVAEIATTQARGGIAALDLMARMGGITPETPDDDTQLLAELEHELKWAKEMRTIWEERLTTLKEQVLDSRVALTQHKANVDSYARVVARLERIIEWGYRARGDR